MLFLLAEEACWHGARCSATEHDVDPGQYQFKLGAWKLSGPFGQDAPVHGHNLRNVGDRAFGEPRMAGMERREITTRFAPGSG